MPDPNQENSSGLLNAQHIWVPADIRIRKRMSPFDSRSPCAADALFAVTPLMVNGRTAGISGLCDAVADVRRPELQDDAGVRAALSERAGRGSFIPYSVRDIYADALLANYRNTEKKGPIGRE